MPLSATNRSTSACTLQPVAGGVGLAAHLDLIAGLRATDGTVVELMALPATEAPPALRRTTRNGFECMQYCCNLEVLSLMIRSGYLKIRAGSEAYGGFLESALAGCAPLRGEIGVAAGTPQEAPQETPLFVRLVLTRAARERDSGGASLMVISKSDLR